MIRLTALATERNDECYLDAEHAAHEQVAPEIVGTEDIEVTEARRLENPVKMRREVIVRADERPEYR